MPIYICSIAESTLSADTKHDRLARSRVFIHRSTTCQAPM